MQRGGGLIFDIGAHSGEDTDFYLRKGFRVIAVEANPFLAERLAARFAAQVADGSLYIVDKAITKVEQGELSFFVNKAKDDWSSLDRTTASKGVMDVAEVRVETVRLKELFDQFGVPYYLKVDIEGGDLDIAESLLTLSSLPAYVSFEFHEDRMLAVLEAAGYRQYQIINQWLHGLQPDPGETREGKYYWPGSFSGYHSGLFGEDLPEYDWVDYSSAMAWRLANTLSSQRGLMRNSWYDLHARR